MTFLVSLDPKDRKLLLICVSAVVALAGIMAFLTRNQNNDDNPLPSSYLTGRHGAHAAYDLLQQSGYSVQRWEQPLGDLAARTDEHTVVILAEPILSTPADSKAVEKIVERGGQIGRAHV